MTIIHRDVLNGLSSAERAFTEGVLNAGEATKSYYASHTFMRIYFPPDDPRHEFFRTRLKKWRKFWCETRPLQKAVHLSDGTAIQQGENYPKGSLCVRHGTNAGFPEL